MEEKFYLLEDGSILSDKVDIGPQIIIENNNLYYYYSSENQMDEKILKGSIVEVSDNPDALRRKSLEIQASIKIEEDVERSHKDCVDINNCRRCNGRLVYSLGEAEGIKCPLELAMQARTYLEKNINNFTDDFLKEMCSKKCIVSFIVDKFGSVKEEEFSYSLNIKENSKAFYDTLRHITLWKNSYKGFGHPELSKEEATELLTKGITKNKVKLYSKSKGKYYDAYLTFDIHCQRTGITFGD